MEQTPNQFAATNIEAALALLFTPVVESMTKEQVEAYETACKEGDGTEFAFFSEDDGETYALRVIGVINGLLAKQSMTLQVMADNDTGAYLGLLLEMGKRFGESIPTNDDEVQLCSFFGARDEYALFAKGRPGVADIYLRVKSKGKWAPGYHVTYWEGGAHEHVIGRIYSNKLRQLFFGNAERQYKYILDKAIKRTSRKVRAADDIKARSTRAKKHAYEVALRVTGIRHRHSVVKPEVVPACRTLNYCTEPCCFEPSCEQPDDTIKTEE